MTSREIYMTSREIYMTSREIYMTSREILWRIYMVRTYIFILLAPVYLLFFLLSFFPSIFIITNPLPGNELLSKDQFVDVVREKLDQVSVIWDSLYADWDETLEELDISMFACVFVCQFV